MDMNILFDQSQSYFFDSISSKVLRIEDTITAAFTGVDTSNLNFVNIMKPIDSIDPFLLQIEEFFQKVTWDIVIREDFNNPSLKKSLNTIGFYNNETAVAMVMEPSSYEDKFDIRNTDDRLEDWIFPLNEAFECTPEVGAQYAQVHQRARDRNAVFYHFTAYHENMPVSSSTLSFHDSIARIDDVGTLPSHTGKGYGSAVVKKALSCAKELGAKYCFLEASSVGLSIYEKLGFRPLFRELVYSRIIPG
jgi:GNAT superfamily N-acetyltransferase